MNTISFPVGFHISFILRYWGCFPLFPFALFTSLNELGQSFNIKCSTKNKLSPNHLEKVVSRVFVKSQRVPKISCHQSKDCNLWLPGVYLSHLYRKENIIHLRCKSGDYYNMKRMIQRRSFFHITELPFMNSSDQFRNISYRIYLEKY